MKLYAKDGSEVIVHKDQVPELMEAGFTKEKPSEEESEAKEATDAQEEEAQEDASKEETSKPAVKRGRRIKK